MKKRKSTKMTTTKFREELKKIMPGYKWTVHRPICEGASFFATGIKSSGMNRISTLSVNRREFGGVVRYKAKSAGFGKRAGWLAWMERGTLAQAPRDLQKHYEAVGRNYLNHGHDIEMARAKHRAEG